MKKHWKFALASFLALLAVTARNVEAQPYPSKPVRLIVTFAPGGGADFLGRLIGQKLNEAWGQPVIVENRTGAGGNIGTGVAAKSPPDGYTLLLAYISNFVVSPFLYKQLPYDPVKDFVPVTLTTTAPTMLVIHPSVPARSVKELVVLGNAKPGALNYATSGTGSIGHLAGELFRIVTGTQVTHVPYKGSGAAITELLGGQVQLMFNSPGTVITHVRSGKLRAVAVASAKREAEISEVPTFAESGYPGIEAAIWYGIVCPAGTPKEIVAKLNHEVVRILQIRDVSERLASQGNTVVTSTPEQFSEVIRGDLAKWGKVIKSAGISLDN